LPSVLLLKKKTSDFSIILVDNLHSFLKHKENKNETEQKRKEASNTLPALPSTNLLKEFLIEGFKLS
jgi:hypothetical protein